MRFRLSNGIKDVYSGRYKDYMTSGTFEENMIKDFRFLTVSLICRGGGNPSCLYIYFDDCLLKGRCPFHDLFNWVDIYELSEKQENAYILLYRKFNFSDEVVRAIKDNNEAKDIRLGDVLHRIYHKDPSITWQRINGIISS